MRRSEMWYGLKFHKYWDIFKTVWVSNGLKSFITFETIWDGKAGWDNVVCGITTNFRSWWWYPSYAQFVLCLATSTHTCDQVTFSSLWLLLNSPRNLKTNMNHIFLNIGIWTPPLSRKYVLFFQLCILHRCFT